ARQIQRSSILQHETLIASLRGLVEKWIELHALLEQHGWCDVQRLRPWDRFENLLSPPKRLVDKDPAFELKRIKAHHGDWNFSHELCRRLPSAETLLKKREGKDLAVLERHDFAIHDH